MKNERVLQTLFAIHHSVMMDVVEDEELNTVGKDIKENVDIAKASINILAIKINKG